MSLLEHNRMDQLLKAQELKNGSIPVYRVEVAPHTVYTAWAEMPAKTCEAFYLDSDVEKGFLVMNEMDDYCRYQALPESAFASKPVYLRNATPFQDVIDKKNQVEAERSERLQQKKEGEHREFFEQATNLNNKLGEVCPIPASYEEYRSGLSSEQFLGPVGYADLPYLERLISEYEGVAGKPVNKYSFNADDSHHVRMAKAGRDLKVKIFEARNGYSIEAKLLDDVTLSMKALNPNGAVLESAIVHFTPGMEIIDDEPEDVAFLDVFDEDNDSFRFGRRIDPEDSLLIPVLADFEEGCFDLSEGSVLNSQMTDGGVIVYGMDDLKGMNIYEHISREHNDISQKLSLMSKASMNRAKERKHETTSPTL